MSQNSRWKQFGSDWAKMTRFCSKEDDYPIEPLFITFQEMNKNIKGYPSGKADDCVTMSFMFSNSKINDLKLKVKEVTAQSGQPITNPTRVEVLNWLLYNRAVAVATKNNSGSFTRTGVGHLTNIRGKMMEPLPENSIGNIYTLMEIFTNNESELKPEAFISELKKQKMQVKGLKNIETVMVLVSDFASDNAIEEQHKKLMESYVCTSMCGFPIYNIDFGWGKPIKATLAGNLMKNSFLLMDVPSGDGIEALVCLEKEDMNIIQSDPELLAYC